MFYRLRSLFLTGLFSFILPLVTIASLFAIFLGIGWVPFLQSTSTAGLASLTNILYIFGSGNLLEGILLISSVGCIVAVLFNTYSLWLLVRPIHQDHISSTNHELVNVDP